MTDRLIEQSSRHSIYVQRYGGYIANQFDPYIEQLKKEIAFIMSSAPETTQDMRIINRLINQIRKAQMSFYGEYNDDILFADLKEFATLESQWEVKNLSSAMESTTVKFVAAAPDQVWAGVMAEPLVFPSSNGVKQLDPFIKDIQNISASKVSDAVRTGFITGRSSQQITQDIIGKGKAVDRSVRHSVQMAVRTSVNHVSSVARQKTMADNDDIVIGYEWVSTLDSRTSDTCRYLDGVVFKNSQKNKRYPPAHPFCRSSISPVLDKRYAIDVDGATRASAGVSGGKQVDADSTYYGWLKTQGKQGKKGREFVKDVLGEERGRLFLDGGLSSNEFKKLTIDQHFRPIPLNELKKKESLQLAFDAIN